MAADAPTPTPAPPAAAPPVAAPPVITAATPASTSSAPGAVTDRRAKLTGGLPRRVQTWLMGGLAVLILLIILITGQPKPVAPVVGRQTNAAEPASPSLIRGYQGQLQQEEAEREAEDRGNRQRGRGPAGRGARPGGPGDASADQDSVADRASHGLFADNVVFSRRPPAEQPSPTLAMTDRAPAARVFAPSPATPAALGGQFAALEQALASARGAASPVAIAGDKAEPPALPPPITAANHSPASRSAPDPAIDTPAAGPRLRLLEGTVIETVLLTRLNGTFAGPVACLVTTPVYSEDRQHVLIPAGARVLGSAAPVQSLDDSRLAVSFHRLVMPDGHTYSLDVFKGLDQVGESGLTGDVNHHYLEVFGASAAIGALSGLTQYGTSTGVVTSFGDEYRQAAGSSLANSSTRVLDRYLNVLPTITIREGYRVKVYLTADVELPIYESASSGGVE